MMGQAWVAYKLLVGGNSKWPRSLAMAWAAHEALSSDGCSWATSPDTEVPGRRLEHWPVGAEGQWGGEGDNEDERAARGDGGLIRFPARRSLAGVGFLPDRVNRSGMESPRASSPSS